VVGADAVAALEIGGRPRHAQQPVIATGREPAPAHRVGEQCVGVAVEPAVPPDARDGELGVRAAAARDHPRTRGADPFADAGRYLAMIVGAQPLVGDARDMDPKVDAVEERTGDPRAVPLDRVQGPLRVEVLEDDRGPAEPGDRDAELQRGRVVQRRR